MTLPVGDKGFDADDTKYQPAKLSDRKREGQGSGKWNGTDVYTDGDKSKVTKETGWNEDFGYEPSPYGNFSEKDASIKRLQEINKGGQVIQEFAATKRVKMTTTDNNGGTAYNGRPIPETYKCATSNGAPDANAVVYKTKVKDQNP